MKFIEGDATQPQGEGNKIIIHCCNDIGAWGAGFVMALSNRWPEPEQSYRQWHKDRKYKDNFGFNLNGEGFLAEIDVDTFELGNAIICQVLHDTFVVNIIGQSGTANPDNQSPVVYDAIRSGVKHVKEYAGFLNASVHMPRMGCGLAGGEWSEIEKIINEELDGIDVTVYDFPE